MTWLYAHAHEQLCEPTIVNCEYVSLRKSIALATDLKSHPAKSAAWNCWKRPRWKRFVYTSTGTPKPFSRPAAGSSQFTHARCVLVVTDRKRIQLMLQVMLTRTYCWHQHTHLILRVMLTQCMHERISYITLHTYAYSTKAFWAYQLSEKKRACWLTIEEKYKLTREFYSLR